MSQSSRASMNTSNSTSDRKLRYLALLDDLSKLDIEITNNDECIRRTAGAVREARLLQKGDDEVPDAGEGYLNSKVLRVTSDLAVRCSESISGNANTYDKHTLASCIKDNSHMWSFSLPLEVPPVTPLFGALRAAPPPRAPRRRVLRQRAADLKEPEAVDKLEKTEEGSELVNCMKRAIKRKYRDSGNQPLSYMRVVLDPTSFARTVENIYHVSFLARDGMLKVDLDASGLPTVTPVPQTEHDDLAEENQFVISIDMPLWQDLIEAFKITKPMIVLK